MKPLEFFLKNFSLALFDLYFFWIIFISLTWSWCSEKCFVSSKEVLNANYSLKENLVLKDTVAEQKD